MAWPNEYLNVYNRKNHKKPYILFKIFKLVTFFAQMTTLGAKVSGLNQERNEVFVLAISFQFQTNLKPYTLITRKKKLPYEGPS